MEHVPCQSVNLLTTVKQIGTPVVKLKESQILHAFLLSPFDPDEDYVERFFLTNQRTSMSFLLSTGIYTCPVAVTLTDKLQKFFRNSNSKAHIHVSLSPTEEETDLGHLVTICKID